MVEERVEASFQAFVVSTDPLVPLLLPAKPITHLEDHLGLALRLCKVIGRHEANRRLPRLL